MRMGGGGVGEYTWGCWRWMRRICGERFEMGGVEFKPRDLGSGRGYRVGGLNSADMGRSSAAPVHGRGDCARLSMDAT
jgi:hypothetical protein